MFGFDVRREGIRTFVLARLSQPELTGGRFTVAKKLDLNDYPAARGHEDARSLRASKTVPTDLRFCRAWFRR